MPKCEVAHEAHLLLNLFGRVPAPALSSEVPGEFALAGVQLAVVGVDTEGSGCTRCVSGERAQRGAGHHAQGLFHRGGQVGVVDEVADLGHQGGAGQGAGSPRDAAAQRAQQQVTGGAVGAAFTPALGFDGVAAREGFLLFLPCVVCPGFWGLLEEGGGDGDLGVDLVSHTLPVKDGRDAVLGVAGAVESQRSSDWFASCGS
ncbi:hypothetical protein [Hydrogenophaga sp.]|uniref:hypothetical protein n=1 Tax=Hydrogenophaga sp. TaxID=1904254 RepID=UPI003AF7E86D